MSATEPSAIVTEGIPVSGEESQRVADARSRAGERLHRQRATLRPLGWTVIVIVAAGTFGSHPAPALHGKGLGVTLALCVFTVALAFSVRDRFADLDHLVQAVWIATIGASGVALIALQPRNATVLAGGAAVWLAVARLPPVPGVALGAGITVALDVATALAGNSAAAVLATTLLCVLLAVVAYFLRQAREDQARTELLMAALQDAREEQTRAAAIAERSRIAGDLHDVLAHSLSGAAIQLQGARMLAEREHAGTDTRAAIDRATELVKDGLSSARQAVGALRGEELASIAQLEALVESFRADMNLDLSLTIEGEARSLPGNASLALYRGAQEALTNIARYAPGARTFVVLRYETDRTTLSVQDRLPARASVASAEGLPSVGGGRGLAGMRERVERAGGAMSAGPIEDGWRVELEVPA